MRLATLALVPLAFVPPSCAQYFSAGWAPGQAVPSDTPSTSSFEPEPTASPRCARASPLFARFGINITEHLESTQASSQVWDDRIPLVTDDNYDNLIVNEVLTKEEEKHRVWFLIITASSAQASAISLYADQQYDETYNLTQIENDLPFVRWGRIDYMNVTHITTKWAVWNAPVLVAVSDRGKTLRFWRATQIRLRPELLREFLGSGMWEHTPPWQSSFAPGGNREFVMEWQAIIMTKLYNIIRVVPRWALYILTGILGSAIMNLVHRGGGKSETTNTKPVSVVSAQSTVTGSSTAVKPSATTPAKGKGRKGKK
ncbi:hypothetical protein BC826DRAFT_1089259 [Russula brevipes]|nr:hypothetical protein BC826DRAFT_1089259 [Russula brevipes]